MLTNGKGPTIVSYPELAETKTGEIVEMSNASFTAKTNTINISPEIDGRW